MPRYIYCSLPILLVLLSAQPIFGQVTNAKTLALLPPTAAALKKISADELKGDLSFLASDALAGRYTPSPGLEAAAEFIASKFRLFGLEPGGTQDYFQIAQMIDWRAPKIDSAMRVKTGSRSIEVPANDLKVDFTNRAVRLQDTPAVLFAGLDTAALKKADVRGKAVVHTIPDIRKLSADQMMSAYEQVRTFSAAANAEGAALELIVVPPERKYPATKMLSAATVAKQSMPKIMVSNRSFEDWFKQASAANESGSSVTIDIPAPEQKEVQLKNVVGILRGSDPKLKATCVLLTAHYDHIGTIETGRYMAPPAKANTTDRIYNGANDDGSGTVSVIEIARALSAVRPRPRRSIVFVTFFGEERGELGSQYYGEHPVFPINKTVADLNLEQVGRTDSTVGPQVNTASLTGYDYSDLTKYLENAGRLTGIKVYKDNEASDAYFTRSDNAALAEQGIPAHTLTVAFDYPDYHGLGDEWQKIDYNNMARVDRMVALALLNVANSAKAPAWNQQNAKTEPFRQAQLKAAGK